MTSPATIALPLVEDDRGKLSFGEVGRQLPFTQSAISWSSTPARHRSGRACPPAVQPVSDCGFGHRRRDHGRWYRAAGTSSRSARAWPPRSRPAFGRSSITCRMTQSCLCSHPKPMILKNIFRTTKNIWRAGAKASDPGSRATADLSRSWRPRSMRRSRGYCRRAGTSAGRRSSEFEAELRGLLRGPALRRRRQWAGSARAVSSSAGRWSGRRSDRAREHLHCDLARGFDGRRDPCSGRARRRDALYRPEPDRGGDNSQDPLHHAGSPLRPSVRHGCDQRDCPRARPARRRGCGPGARRLARWPKDWNPRGRGRVEFLSDQESRRIRRCRGSYNPRIPRSPKASGFSGTTARP